MRFLAVLVLAGCVQSHAGRTEVRGEDCSTCHLDDFESTSLPPHRQRAFPESCGDCHRTSSWGPALEDLHPPEPKFPLAGASHDNIKCLGCHDLDSGLPSKDAANTDCLQCHPSTNAISAQHDGARKVQGVAFTYLPDIKNFCFTCHPTGIITRHAATNPFRLTGPHDAYCVRCHDQALGEINNRDNSTCLRSGCHSLQKMDSEHDEPGYATQRGNGSNPHFCLASGCHPDGRKEGD